MLKSNEISKITILSKVFVLKNVNIALSLLFRACRFCCLSLELYRSSISVKQLYSFPLSPSNGRSVCQFLSFRAQLRKSVHQHILPLSGNYVFYLGDTYGYFNIGYPAVLMAHYSNNWGKNCWGW